MKESNSKFCSVLVNDLGDILSHTCRPTREECKEYCEEFFPAWEKMKELGCKIVYAEIKLLD